MMKFSICMPQDLNLYTKEYQQLIRGKTMTDQHIDIEDDLNAIRCAMGNLNDNVGHMTREQRFGLSEMFVEAIKLIVKGKNNE